MKFLVVVTPPSIYHFSMTKYKETTRKDNYPSLNEIPNKLEKIEDMPHPADMREAAHPLRRSKNRPCPQKEKETVQGCSE